MPDRDSEILVHLQYIREAQDQTNTHLQALNGRTRTNEQDIAVLKSRQEDAKREGRNWGAGAGAAGGFLGGFIAAVIQRMTGPAA